MADAILADVESSGIYQIRNLVNGKRYIGSAVRIKSRWATHVSELNSGKHGNRYLLSSWRKYGPSAFAFEVIENCEKSSLIEREQFWMDLENPEYNLSPTAGSCLGVRHSDEVRRKRSERNKGNKFSAGRKMTKKNKDAIIRSNMARRGIPRDPEAVRKTAEAHRGMKRSEETRRRISIAKTGKKMPPRSQECRDKLSVALRGRPKPKHVLDALFAGRAKRVFTDEQRAALSESVRRQYQNGVRCREKSPAHREKIARSVASLEDWQVAEIRRELEMGERGTVLSVRYGVTKGTISRIKHRKIYKWVA